jgi:hypothetical protein
MGLQNIGSCRLCLSGELDIEVQNGTQGSTRPCTLTQQCCFTDLAPSSIHLQAEGVLERSGALGSPAIGNILVEAQVLCRQASFKPPKDTICLWSSPPLGCHTQAETCRAQHIITRTEHGYFATEILAESRTSGGMTCTLLPLQRFGRGH